MYLTADQYQDYLTQDQEQVDQLDQVGEDYTTSTTTVLILNPDGSLSNEFTVGEGVNLETIKQEYYQEHSPTRSSPVTRSSPTPLDLSTSLPLPPMSTM